MKKILLALVLTCVACGSPTAESYRDTSTEPDEPKPVYAKVKPLLDDFVERITIDGMDCLVWKDKAGEGDHTYAYSGLTCDWSMKERK